MGRNPHPQRIARSIYMIIKGLRFTRWPLMQLEKCLVHTCGKFFVSFRKSIRRKAILQRQLFLKISKVRKHQRTVHTDEQADTNNNIQKKINLQI